MALHPLANLTTAQQSEESLLEPRVIEQLAELVDMFLPHQVQGIDEELQLISVVLMKIIRRSILQSGVLPEYLIIRLSRVVLKNFSSYFGRLVAVLEEAEVKHNLKEVLARRVSDARAGVASIADVYLLVADVHVSFFVGDHVALLLDVHQLLHEELDGLLVGLVLHSVFIDESMNSLLKHGISHNFRAEREQLIEHWEYFLMETVGHVVQ
mmetsp:Transcript_1902/g.2661  ORF Transcript_1902/g.2661 Transcript_1902/m.2661 type:complete len:211 (-) Transcript_1902:3767-4399(-)